MKRPTINAIRDEIRKFAPEVAVSWATHLWDGSEDDEEMAPLRLSYEALRGEHKRALHEWIRARGLRVWSHEITGCRWAWRHILTLVADYDGFLPLRSARHWQDRLP